MSLSIDPDSVEDTLADLVRIDSTNPALGADERGAGEAELAAYIADRMHDIGLDVDHWEPAPGRPNVVGVLSGDGDGRSLMWNAHTDTVGVEGMDAPFTPVRQNGRLYGRGAQDMKGSLAAQLIAARTLRESGTSLSGDVLVAAVADEEHKSIGTEALVDRYDADGAVVTEPTDLKLVRAHKGFVWIDLRTQGRAAHGSRPAEGIDANMHMGRVLSKLEALNRSLSSDEAHALVGPPSLHAGQLRGGDAPSVYAAECHLRMERRTVPGESAEDALEEVQTVLHELSEADDAFEAEAEIAFSRGTLKTPADATVASATRAGLSRTLAPNTPLADTGASFWTDAALLSAAGTETVVLGPRGAGLHTTEEWVDLASVAQLAEVLVHTARRYCA
ncbi:M20/M25/M40 family metallo-hydrolase [Salinibacter ruber]|uniref:M20/M25/M40 family metallo-hydrolase n=1 Tax=Salinibacter ruber TaxID=146919 RepID=UPI000DD9AB56|nr:M20/M25/M40 family metallo-hydrolase [Salinibacter ruber]MCS3754684.1 acetylornithine deacetylase [Salinibacter ruber]